MRSGFWVTRTLAGTLLVGGLACARHGAGPDAASRTDSTVTAPTAGTQEAAQPKPIPVQWRYRTASPLSGPPVVTREGQIVFSTLEGYVHSLASNGELLWNYTTVGSPLGSPVSDDRGRVLVVTQAGYIHAIQPDGTAAFTYRVPTTITSPATWSPRGFLVFAGIDNHLWAYSPRAGLLWRMKLPAALTVAPRVLPDGELVLTTERGGVWRTRGRRLGDRLPEAPVPAQPGAGRQCRQPVLERPIAGELRLADRIIVWSQSGQLAAMTPENLAAACP